MFGFDYAQQKAIGLAFVLNQLTPFSPYGIEKKNTLKPFDRNGKDALNECFDTIDKIIALIKNQKSHFDALCMQLMQFKHITAIIRKCEQHTLNQVELFEVKCFLLCFEKMELIVRQLHNSIPLLGFMFQPMHDALDILDNDKKRIAVFTVTSPLLDQIRSKKNHVEALLQKELELVGALPNESALVAQRFALVQQEGEEETRVMQELSEKLRPYCACMLTNMDVIGSLDLAIAKANLALQYGAVRPTISEGDQILLYNMANPFVADALKTSGQTLTAVSLALSKGVTIITGANMGGKSVAIKTATLNVVLCQMGFFVFAQSAEIPLFDGVVLVSEDMQDIGKGLSSFAAEIVCFNEIIQRQKNEFLFIALDEFARGTNPEEGAAIVRAVASYLADAGAVSVMTTHYDGVVPPTAKHYQTAGLHLSQAAAIPKAAHTALGIAQYMDYRLIEVTGDTAPPKDALAICMMLGLDKDVLARIEQEYAKRA